MPLFSPSNTYRIGQCKTRSIEGAPWVLLDWGDTVMVNFPQYSGPMTQWPEVAACPGIETALAALARHYNLALATNAQDSEPADIRKALARVGLGNAFDDIFCYREVGYLKPAPAFFRQIIKKLACRPVDIVMVGDDFAGDIMGAVSSGMQAVWYNPAGGDVKNGPGFRTITALIELEEVLDSFHFQNIIS